MALNCDIETGTCSVGDLTPKQPQQEKEYLHDMALIYIGDPMCSWCWGSSDVVKEARASALEKGIQFSAIVGGLRPGMKRLNAFYVKSGRIFNKLQNSLLVLKY